MMERNAGRGVRSLDLFRSYAICSVFIAHAALAFGDPPALAPLHFGGTGVDLFFVLSGWLLGRQLMLELRSHQSINFIHFWSRRWMRTLPAYYCVLLLTFLQQVLLNHNYDLEWSYVFFGQTYLTHLPYFFISWSLCVEEHFYLLVAPLLALAFKLRKFGIAFIGFVLAVPVVCRSLGFYSALEQTHVRYDECLAGVVLAGVSVFAPHLWKRLCAIAPGIATLGAAVYLWLAWLRWAPQYGIWPDEQTACAFAFASFVLLGVSNEAWKDRLYLPGSHFIATRAYAIYLLHPETLAFGRRLHLHSFGAFVVLTAALTLVVAEILYRVVERPMMDARERFTFSKSQRVSTAPAVQATRNT